MNQNNNILLTRRIGQTRYKVRVCFDETAAETFEDKMLRLARTGGLSGSGEHEVIELPQMSCPSVRSA